MASILQRIVATKWQEIERAKSVMPLAEIQSRLADVPPPRNFLAPLQDSPPIRLIAEVKKASPSKGVIRANFDPTAIAIEYQQAGASCISVLTDEQYFQGSLAYLTAIRQAVTIPILRKDFIVDPYQIYQARLACADAVLLIAECLTPENLSQLYRLTRELGMYALIELYDERNLSTVLDTGTELLGVNNRNLNDFQVDLMHTIKLSKLVPAGRVLVAESGISSRDDVSLLESHGVQAMLVGESLMRAEDIGRATRTLLGNQFQSI